MNAATSPQADYSRRIAATDLRLAAGDRRHLHLSNLRLVVFALGAALAWAAFIRAQITPTWLLVPLLLFAVLMVIHARVLNTNDRLRRARRYYERGLSRIDGTWAGSGPDGSGYAGAHLYGADLDLFGPGSLFQFLDTARTEAGEATLADWLKAPASRDVILARQQAVDELRPNVDFREALAVLAAEAHVSRTGVLTRWANTEPVGLSASHAVLFAGCAGVTSALMAALFLGWLSLWPVLGWLVVAAAVATANRTLVWRAIRAADAAADDLALLEALLVRLEREPFRAERLSTLRAHFDGEVLPSQHLAHLRRLIATRDILRNELARPFGLLLFVRSQAAVAIDRWHQAHRQALAGWLQAIGEFEALSSLATYAYEHPADPFPAIAEGAAQFHAVGLAHPLLDARVAVANDVALGADVAHVLIVSGSNMSGKSTLLRAVGTNAVLALAGAPVRATQLTLTTLAIGASIRVEDSLQQGHSRFYSEILRIRDIVQLADGSMPVLFLLDEILHGTNSHDRRLGAEAVVRTLAEAGAIGFVTTHDLALTTFASTLPVATRNVHFEDLMEGGTMRFDYRMREGVVERSNAIELMRAVGIRV